MACVATNDVPLLTWHLDLHQDDIRSLVLVFAILGGLPLLAVLLLLLNQVFELGRLVLIVSLEAVPFHRLDFVLEDQLLGQVEKKKSSQNVRLVTSQDLALRKVVDKVDILAVPLLPLLVCLPKDAKDLAP